MTAVPRWRDSATFSAAWRQTEQRRKSASPSFHSLVFLSKVRGVDATVKFATAAPLGVKRSSGSAVRFPTTVMMVSPAMLTPSLISAQCCVSTCGVVGGARELGLALVGAQDLGPQHRLVEVHLTVEFLDGRGLRGQVHDGVDAFGLLLDLVREPTTAPRVDLLDLATVVADDGEELLE